MIFNTIAYHLGVFHAPYKACVAEILQRDPLVVHSSITRQFEELILQPLQALRDSFPPCVIVIDALDECRGAQTTSAVLSTILTHSTSLFPLRFFLTSRPEAHITTTFSEPEYRDAFGKLLLHEVALPSVTTDIELYLKK